MGRETGRQPLRQTLTQQVEEGSPRNTRKTRKKEKTEEEEIKEKHTHSRAGRAGCSLPSFVFCLFFVYFVYFVVTLFYSLIVSQEQVFQQPDQGGQALVVAVAARVELGHQQP